MKNLKWTLLSGLMLLSLVLAACAPQQVQVPVTVVVKETQVVKQVETQVVNQVQTQIVPEVQTQVVQQTVAVAPHSFSKPHPILGNPAVRQAIAYCTNPLELIQSVYDWLPADQQTKLLMTGPIPQDSWAYYGGDGVVRYFDPKDPAAGLTKGQKLLDDAGWKLPEGDTARADKDGNRLTLKLTTTNAAFRKTWSAVFVQQMAKCGIEILPLYAPGAWWFGNSTGLRVRDFELGAYAWVGESDPKGQTLYACNQIPYAENGFQGQNDMGWCNKTASDAINAANNSLDKNTRIAQYKTFQVEFSKDMVSLPLFQRAEGNAATTRLQNFKPSATEYYSWNANEWSLSDNKDTLVLAMSQEPDTLYSWVSSMAVQVTVAELVTEKSASQYNWDFQPWTQVKLPTLDSGLTKLNDVDVKEGDPVVDSSGTPVDADGKVLTLKKGLKVMNSDGQEVTYDSGTVKMKQMVTTYQFQPLKWSDGQPVVKADWELAYKHNCDPDSGGVDYSVCQSIQSVDFTGDLEYTVSYKPGSQSYLNTIYAAIDPLNLYPSHLVLTSDKYKGKTLADVPPADWASLPEVAETPLSTGPYMVKEWQKGVKMVLEANPNYWRGPLKIKNITILFIQETNQAVAQLLTGDVDVVGAETLGAGAEVKTVLDAQKAGKPIQVLIVPTATWEHVDMQLFLP